MGKTAGAARPSARFRTDSAPYGGQDGAAPLNSADVPAKRSASVQRKTEGSPDRPARISPVARPAGRRRTGRIAGRGAAGAGDGAPLSPAHPGRAARSEERRVGDGWR